MFNSVAFEVTIGLVFVYLLYSLLTTILSEIIATWLGLRARLLKTTIQRMLEDDKGKIKNRESLSKKFYDHPGIKYLGKNRLFQTPSYISADIFSTTLINLFWKKGSAVTVMEEIKLGMSYHDFSNSPETKKQILSLIEHANGDLNVFKQSIEDWFREMMDRCTGWYKRQMKLVLLILGFIVAIAFNIDTIKIAKILANSTELRQQVLKIATDPEVNAQLSKIINPDSIKNDKLIRDQYNQLNEYALQLDDVLGLGNTCQQLKAGNGETRCVMIFGWLLTALALSLGSPFWFDLLNKLVALRGAGKNTDAESKKSNEAPEMKSLTKNLKTTDSGHHIANHVNDDPVLIAIAQFKKTLYAIPGVLAVNKGYETTAAGTKDACVEITVDSNCNKALLPATYSITLNAVAITVKTKIVDGGIADLHDNAQGMKIQNKTYEPTPNERGSITCVVIDNRTKKKKILSCYHVMRGNNSVFSLNGEKSIINPDDKSLLAEVSYLYLSETLDVALADLPLDSNLNNISEIKNVRPVLARDGNLGTEIDMFGAFSGKVSGYIHQDTVDFPFHYEEGDRMMYNLIRLTQKVNGVKKAISQPGDSGAIICDKKGNAIGMIIGGKDEYSYALKLNEVIDSLKITPVYQS